MWRWENQPMIDITEKVVKRLPSDEIVGVVSHKFCEKTGVTKEQVERTIAKYPRNQVWNFSRIITRDPKWNFMDWSDQGHKGIKGMIQRLCSEIGLKYTNNPKHIVYANQFVARNDIFCHYIRTVIVPCLEILETTLWEVVDKPAGYTRAMDAKKLKELTGLEYYNYVPFILERMLMQYIDHYKVKTFDYHR